VLTWDTAGTDNTPQFTAVFDDTHVWASGSIDGSNYDDIQFQWSTSAVFAAPSTGNNTLDAAELLAGLATLTTGALAEGLWYARCRHNHVVAGVSHISAWSNTVSQTINFAPTLSSPTGTKTGTSTASLGVTTDQSGGTLYWVVTTSATPPSAAQVKAGQNDGGTAAAASGSQAVAASGAQSISGGATGLTPSTTYYAHYMHEDAGANQSNVADSASFTTDSAGVTFALAFTEGRVEASGGTTITHTGVSFGAADTNRVIAVVVAARMVTVNTITGVTIGGVAATEAVSARATVAGTNGSNSGIWYASVPTGTSGDIVVTHGAAAARTGIAAYRVVTSTPAPTSSNSANGAASPLSAAITVPTGGAGIAGLWQNGSVTDSTWSNATQDYQATSGGSSRMEAATVSTIGSVSPGGTTGGNSVLSAAAWGP
jgi:hypothetical protein